MKHVDLSTNSHLAFHEIAFAWRRRCRSARTEGLQEAATDWPCTETAQPILGLALEGKGISGSTGFKTIDVDFDHCPSFLRNGAGRGVGLGHRILTRANDSQNRPRRVSPRQSASARPACIGPGGEVRIIRCARSGRIASRRIRAKGSIAPNSDLPFLDCGCRRGLPFHHDRLYSQNILGPKSVARQSSFCVRHRPARVGSHTYLG